MAELEEVDYQSSEPEISGLLDEDEFSHAFEVFSGGTGRMPTTNSVLYPFLKSLGLEPNNFISHIKEGSHHNTIDERQLYKILSEKTSGSLEETWPSDRDVLGAFKVFDTEGVGFIKVTMLKRFLVQAQLNVDEGVLERLIRDNCQIDGDDLINYADFVTNISKRYDEINSERNPTSS